MVEAEALEIDSTEPQAQYKSRKKQKGTNDFERSKSTE